MITEIIKFWLAKNKFRNTKCYNRVKF